MSPIITKSFANYEQTVAECMRKAGCGVLFKGSRPVMLKPNLVNDSPHPVTTPPDFCDAVISFVRQHTHAPVVIAEGCGDAAMETMDVFDRLGYTEMAGRRKVDLLDLNTAPLRLVKSETCSLFPEMWLPECVFDHVLLSLPVLKAHSLCRFTGSMKNMMGMVPPEHYGGRYGSWKKASFHQRLDQSIVELNRYRSPDFTVMDATIGLADFHLGGRHCQPPVNRILAGFDACTVDREATALLGLDWARVGHLA